VYFNFFTPSKLWMATAQAEGPSAAPEATALDSWLAIAHDGMVTVFTSKVELGTGLETALGQIVAEELDVPFARVKMDSGDTARTIDQSLPMPASEAPAARRRRLGVTAGLRAPKSCWQQLP